jgi:predicted nucleic acid-binding protein
MKPVTVSMVKKALTGKRILVDSTVIIYLTDAIKLYHELSRCLCQMIEKGDAYAIFSMASIAEVMLGPLKKGLFQNAMDVKTYLLNFPNSSCQDITGEVLDKIGEDQRVKWPKLRTVDALIIASGLANNVDRIVSNEVHFQNALPEALLFSFR